MLPELEATYSIFNYMYYYCTETRVGVDYIDTANCKNRVFHHLGHFALMKLFGPTLTILV